MITSARFTKEGPYAYQVLDRQLRNCIVHMLWYSCVHMFHKLLKVGLSGPIDTVVLWEN
jgi:hypothetical protein